MTSPVVRKKDYLKSIKTFQVQVKREEYAPVDGVTES